MKATICATVLVALFALVAWAASPRTVFCQVHGKWEAQRHECAIACRNCQGANDVCCCRTTDKCKCVEPTTGAPCCE